MTRILLVGASSAIAAACARRWAADGAQLMLVGRDADKLEAIARDLTVRGAASVSTFVLDALDTPRHAEMLAAAVHTLGTIDIALIAHGTLPNQQACQLDVSQTLRELASNATSVIALLTLLATHLEGQQHGSLAVITSVAGDRGRPSNYVYGSAKAAVSTFCEGLRPRLFKAGVSLTDIRPGFVNTPMTAGLPLPAMLVAEPDTVATRIVHGIARKRDVLYVPAFWAIILLIVRLLPRPLFKRLSC
ncbi:MAG: SDR family oxidoreductase [Acidobacteria bacterium]|nr:SDR family oxidoreductase [Acidobacteriota bacterium]